MEDITHFRKLENMYSQAPINHIFKPETKISEGSCIISIYVNPNHFHAAKALHGSVYFKMLDDAAYFACSSYNKEVFLLTKTFQIEFKRPITQGKITAKGIVTQNNNNENFMAKAELFNEDGKLVAFGEGQFVTSKIPLNSELGYL